MTDESLRRGHAWLSYRQRPDQTVAEETHKLIHYSDDSIWKTTSTTADFNASQISLTLYITTVARGRILHELLSHLPKKSRFVSGRWTE